MHPAIQSAGLLIRSAAEQLITLVRPAPITLLDITTPECSSALSWVIAEDVRMLKFHVPTALRTAINTHVAEILRDAGAKVISCRT
jgi:hypothetical protein